MEEGARGGEADSGSGDWSGCRLQLTLAYGLQIGAGAALLQAWRGLKLDASFMLNPSVSAGSSLKMPATWRGVGGDPAEDGAGTAAGDTVFRRPSPGFAKIS